VAENKFEMEIFCCIKKNIATFFYKISKGNKEKVWKMKKNNFSMMCI